MLILGHRGASHGAPENTLRAFRLAADEGADGVELDAMVCGSGEVVVCHDEELSRLAGVPWRVAETSLQRLQSLDVGSRLGFSAERIPLLEEVLEALPHHMLVNIELKCERKEDLGLSYKVADLVVARKLSERVLLSSFNPLCLLRAAWRAPTLRRGYLIDPDRSYWLHAGLIAPFVLNHSIHPEGAACTPARLARWRRRGWRVAAWTVDAPERARELKAAGVSYLITNRPGEMKRALA
jgi:glycerophosphoryl diester phosphodiesterase